MVQHENSHSIGRMFVFIILMSLFIAIIITILISFGIGLNHRFIIVIAAVIKIAARFLTVLPILQSLQIAIVLPLIVGFFGGLGIDVAGKHPSSSNRLLSQQGHFPLVRYEFFISTQRDMACVSLPVV